MSVAACPVVKSVQPSAFAATGGGVCANEPAQCLGAADAGRDASVDVRLARDGGKRGGPAAHWSRPAVLAPYADAARAEPSTGPGTSPAGRGPVDGSARPRR